jgi:hypothetical protein
MPMHRAAAVVGSVLFLGRGSRDLGRVGPVLDFRLARGPTAGRLRRVSRARGSADGGRAPGLARLLRTLRPQRPWHPRAHRPTSATRGHGSVPPRSQPDLRGGDVVSCRPGAVLWGRAALGVRARRVGLFPLLGPGPRGARAACQVRRGVLGLLCSRGALDPAPQAVARSSASANGWPRHSVSACSGTTGSRAIRTRRCRRGR